MSLRTIDTVLLQQALIVGSVEDGITGVPLAQVPILSLFVRDDLGRTGRRIPLPARILPGGLFVFAGDPAISLPRVPAGMSLDLRLITQAVGYFGSQIDFSLTSDQVTPIEETRSLGGGMVTIERLPAPLATHVVRLTPQPIHLAGSVVEADNPGAPVAGASVRVIGVEGIRIVGRLHYSHGTDPVAAQDETEAVEIEVLRDLPAGSDRLPHGTPGPFSAGDVLRIRTDPGDTEYVTIASDGDSGFREPGLAFTHPRATTAIHRVTLTDRAGEPASGRTMGQAAPHGASVIELTDVTGLAGDQVIRVGDGATREYQVTSDVAPFGPVVTDERGFFILHDVPVRSEIDISVEHEDFAALETTVELDYRQPVNERVFTLTA